MFEASRKGAVLTGVIVALACACGVEPAQAQFETLSPAFSRLTGGMLWGSLGLRDIRRPERLVAADRNPAVRGGVAALYGPFGGQPDTTVLLDSVRTTVEAVQHPEEGSQSMGGADSVRAVRSTHGRLVVSGRSTRNTVAVGDTIRTVRSMHSHYTIPGRDGWLSLGVGYEYSSSYAVNLSGRGSTLSATFPVGGIYTAAFFGPFPVWHAPRPMFWSAGLGASLVQLSDANGVSDSTFVRFNTERALAPEAQVMLGCRVRRGVRVLAGLSAQHIGWSAIRYRAPSELPLADSVLRQLPHTLRLTTVHLALGLSFDASDLFTR